MKLQQLLSLTRKAVDTYKLIEEGDRIAYRRIRRKGLSGVTICPARSATFLSEAFYPDSGQCRSWHGRFLI